MGALAGMAEDNGTTSTASDGDDADGGSNTGSTATAPPPNTGRSGTAAATVDPEDEIRKWRNNSRQHEAASKQNGRRADKAEQDLADARAEHETALTTAVNDAAVARLERALVRRGLEDDAIEAIVGLVDPARLLKDGKPDLDAIKKLAETVPAAPARTGPPDPTQGQGANGSAGPISMDQLIRRAAGRL